MNDGHRMVGSALGRGRILGSFVFRHRRRSAAIVHMYVYVGDSRGDGVNDKKTTKG